MKKTFVIHPILFGIFPILFLFAHNIGEVAVIQIVAPIAITTVSVLILWTILYFIIRDQRKAGIIVSLFVLIFFSYGHFYNLIQNFILVIWGFRIRPNAILFFSSVVLSLFGVYAVLKIRGKLHSFTNLLNVISSVLILISLINIGAYAIKSQFGFRGKEYLENAKTESIDLQKVISRPNIYYIILDAHARADILKEIYDYDNSEFINHLTQKGFYVAKQSRSNYCQTFLSIASSLNLKYLDELVDQIGVGSVDKHPIQNMVRNNLVYRILKQLGYTTIALDASAYEIVEAKDADIFYKTPGLSLSGFHNELLNSTPIPFITRKIISIQIGLRVLEKMGKLDELTAKQYDYHRKRILYAFEKLGDLSKRQGPFIVYAHILAPHQPFVFNKNGEPISPEGMRFSLLKKLSKDEYIKEYKDQLCFIDKKVMETVEKILQNSPDQPIIILQADHGSASEWHGPNTIWDIDNSDNRNLIERTSILNAYYLPGDGRIFLYDEITPVNTFRLIFSHYFGMDFELLKDEIHFSTAIQPYKFINVTNRTNPDIIKMGSVK